MNVGIKKSHKKNKIWMVIILLIIILTIKTNVEATKLHFIYHKNLFAGALKNKNSEDTRYNIVNLNKQANNQNNVNLDLFVNKENDIFIFHPASKCQNKRVNYFCKNLNEQAVFNEKTDVIVKKYQIFKLNTVLKILTKAKSITMELKNFAMHGVVPYQKLTTILNTKVGKQILKKIQFESFNTSGPNNDYLKIKHLFPNNLFWKLMKKSDNIKYWINLANTNKKLALSFNIINFVKNINKMQKQIFAMYKNQNICFWTIKENINNKASDSQTIFFNKLLNSDKFLNLKNIYIMSEVANYNPNLLEKGTQLIEANIKKTKIQNSTVIKIYRDFLNKNNGQTFINYDTQKNYNKWNKQLKQVILNYVNLIHKKNSKKIVFIILILEPIIIILLYFIIKKCFLKL